MHGPTSRPNDPWLSGPFDPDRMAEIRIRPVLGFDPSLGFNQAVGFYLFLFSF